MHDTYVYNGKFISAARKMPPDLDTMEGLLKNGVDINVYDEDDDSTFLSDIFEYYVEDQLDYNVGDNWKSQAIQRGIDGRYLPTLAKFFLDHGYDVNMNHHANGGKALLALVHSSFDHYATEAARILLEAGADVNYVEDKESYPYYDVVGSAWDSCTYFDGHDGYPDDDKFAGIKELAELFEDYQQKRMIKISKDADGYGEDYTIYLSQTIEEQAHDGSLEVEKCISATLHIDEYVVNSLLGYFLEKYYNPNYDKNTKINGKISQYSHYGTYHYYLYTVEQMIEEIGHIKELLRMDYKSVSEKITGRYKPESIIQEPNILSSYMDHDAFMQDNIRQVIMFYEEFIAEMEALINIALKINKYGDCSVVFDSP